MGKAKRAKGKGFPGEAEGRIEWLARSRLTPKLDTQIAESLQHQPTIPLGLITRRLTDTILWKNEAYVR